MQQEEMYEELSKLRIMRSDGQQEKKLASSRLLIGAIILLVAGLGLSALYIYNRPLSSATKDSSRPASATDALASQPGGISQVGSEDIVLTAAGYVTSGKRVELGSKIIGRIASLDLDEGSIVREGQVLARLQNRELQAQLQQAQADLEVAEKRCADLVAGSRAQEVQQAKARLEQAAANLKSADSNLERYRQLYRQAVISTQQMDNAQNEYEVRAAEHKTAQEALDLVKAGPRPDTVEVAKAEIQRAKAQVEFCKAQLADTLIVAPFTGVVTEKLAEVGEVVAPGMGSVQGLKTGIVRVASLSDLRVDLDINETDLGKLQLNQPADIVLDSAPHKTYKGYLAKIYPEANRQKGTVKVEIAVTNPDSQFMPEMSAKVVLKKILNDFQSK
ncbi:MAG TPA: efflux RND transporter periplasmic adaptor subunit [Blastocatellia bacterium]|jgi:multidrug resistance efflux pump